MACNPTRLELSNTDATTVDVTLTTDPGDGTAVVLEVPGLSISSSQNTASAAVSYTIAARTEGTHSLWDGTIQVGANAPADIVVQIVETAAAQAVGLTITDADVSYCAPSAPGGGGTGTVTSVGLNVPGGFTVAGTNPITTTGTFEITSTLDGIIKADGAATFSGDAGLDDLSDVVISLPVAKQVLYYNGSDWRNVSLSSGDIPSLDASKITSGTFVDARIAESSVTQHASAIDLNDLGDVTIATGAGNDGDLVYYDHAAGAGAKFKGAARSSISLTEFDNDLTESDLPAIQDSYLMLIESPSDKTYTIDARVAAGRTVTNFYAKTSSGTCTATLKNLTDTTTIGTISVTSTGGSAASLSNTTLDENDRVAIEISSNSSSADLEMVVEYTQ